MIFLEFFQYFKNNQRRTYMSTFEVIEVEE